MSDSSAALLPNTLPGGNARIETVSWRYRLLSAEPAGLQVHLCSLNRCIPLTSASGTSHALAGEAADGPLRFVYSVQTRGPLNRRCGRLPIRLSLIISSRTALTGVINGTDRRPDKAQPPSGAKMARYPRLLPGGATLALAYRSHAAVGQVSVAPPDKTALRITVAMGKYRERGQTPILRPSRLAARD